MGGINVGRWLAGGIVAGIVIWILEGAASFLYMEEATAALQRHGLSMKMDATMWALIIVICLLSGLALVFFYAAARPRFGPGPKTAIVIAIAAWVMGYVITLLGYRMIGLYPGSMLGLWAVIGLVEMVVASLVGAWVYREA